jgi:hypothetical protein
VIVEATWEDALEVCLNMRGSDREEVMATRWSDSPYEFAADCMRAPGSRFTAIYEGRPVMLGGVAMNQPGIGQAWMVGTDEIGKLGVEIAHASKAIFSRLLEGHVHRIQAYSIATHQWAHSWLRKIGFVEAASLKQFGKRGEDFVLFEMLKERADVRYTWPSRSREKMAFDACAISTPSFPISSVPTIQACPIPG